MQFDLVFAFEETLDKPFIYLGMLGFLILLFMASTSTKKLFARYNAYHKAIYVALILLTVHFIMAQKSLNMPQYFYLVLIVLIAFFKLKQRLHF
jgi:sulfoxide reductase heme-binding subunit YedZ